MKNAFFIGAVLLFTNSALQAQQEPSAYHTHVEEGARLLALKQYLPAAHAYSAAFESFGWKGYAADRYSAAQSWALAAVPDSAFYNLERLAQKANFSDIKTLQKDTAFVAMHTDARWPALVSAVKKNSGINDATYNPALVHQIDSLAAEDQKWRNSRRELSNNGHVDSLQLAQAVQMILRADSLNYLATVKIVDQYGFPDADLLGKDGTKNFWLLVQHQDKHPDFQQRVLQLMEVAVKQNKASGKDYAYLLDRVLVNTGKPQVYGTQMQLNAAGTSFEPKPCTDPEHLDERRTSVGLGTMASYIDIMNHNFSGELKKQ